LQNPLSTINFYSTTENGKRLCATEFLLFDNLQLIADNEQDRK